MSGVAERFARDTARHEVTVLRDDGLYRHLRCQAPDTWMYGFEIVTWPGYLFIGGDIEDFVFARTADMFDFFEKGSADSEGINPHYWAQKLQGADARSSGGRKYTVEAFQFRILEWARGALQAWDEEAAEADREWDDEHFAVYPHLLIGALEREVFPLHPYDEREAHAALDDWQWLFGETWEWDLREFDPWFLWACHAIVWAIERYRDLSAVGSAQ
jgi:hypothetical protein